MNILHTLNKKLLSQAFEEGQESISLLNDYKQVAQLYSAIENAIAVLSDMKSNKSYIYNGGFAIALGLEEKGNTNEIYSIWEREIFDRIHPDDLLGKHKLELQFFHLLKTLTVPDCLNYHVVSRMRMRNGLGKYIAAEHRMFYLLNSLQDSPRFSLCLYNFSYSKSICEMFEGMIVNSVTGEIIIPDDRKYVNILSKREKEILQLIAQGNMSKEISEILSISINTVNRHRQNILEKLRVKNSIEAFRIADLMGLL